MNGGYAVPGPSDLIGGDLSPTYEPGLFEMPADSEVFSVDPPAAPGDISAAPAVIDATIEDTTNSAAAAATPSGEASPTQTEVQHAATAWLLQPSLFGLPRWLVLSVAGYLGYRLASD